MIADSHLGGPGGPAAPMIAQLEALPDQGCRHLVLLGDIFHVWVGSQRFETEEVRKVLPVLRELGRAGIRVDYVEGNRDFFLDRGPYASSFHQVASELAFEVGGRKVLAVHGDGLNDRDRQYLFWRWLSKSALSRFFVLRLPRRLAQRLVHSTEARLARSNFKHKQRIPEEAVLSYARRRFEEGHQVMILGHFHEEHRWQLPQGEVWLLDAWFRSRRVEWLGRETESS